jgi:mono/diheme cytochrome c family protein/rhodanese-related sulfurtransferase
MQRFSFLVKVLALLLGIGLFGCNPLKPARAERHGSQIYRSMCAVCHGATGAGYKADQAPALTHADFLASVTDEFLRSAIMNGRTGTTMSAWAFQRGGPLMRNDVESLIKFMRAAERTPKAALDEHPLAGDATRGGEIYERECARCHGDKGVGGPFIHIGNAQLLGSASNGFLRHAIRNGRPGTSMPGFRATLGEAAIDDVVALLRAWQTATPPSKHQPPASPAPPLALGPVPLNPKGPEPSGFKVYPASTPAETIKAQLDRHAKMALLDARAPSDYTNEHIAGAVSVPFYDPEPYVAALPKDAWLVCYCSCPHAESGQLAQKLVAKGFAKVTVLDEGLGFWKSKKYETHTGADP